jgi:hypothetical protein
MMFVASEAWKKESEWSCGDRSLLSSLSWVGATKKGEDVFWCF